MAHFAQQEPNRGSKKISATKCDTNPQTEPERRLTDDRIHQTFVKHYFNKRVNGDADLRRSFDRALETILTSFKARGDVFWTMGEAAQLREQRAASDRSWQSSKDFWFMLFDPEEPLVAALLPAHDQEAISYALRDYKQPDMSGNLAQAHVSIAKTMIARSATFEIRDLGITNAPEDQITAVSDEAERLIKQIEDAVVTAKGVYESACRDAARAQSCIRHPGRILVGP